MYTFVKVDHGNVTAGEEQSDNEAADAFAGADVEEVQLIGQAR